MGLSGLALAWYRAEPRMGEVAAAVAWALGGLAALAFAALAVATLLRGRRHAEAWAEDRRHPVRHTFVAALPVAVILLATVAVSRVGPHPLAHALWAVGAVAQFGVTLWVMARWLRPAAGGAGGLAWAGVTPALLIPIVGNVLVPLAGVPLGQVAWSAAQFGFGLLAWPLVFALLLVRLAVQGPWPERLRPTVAILIAPPAVVGLAALQFGAPPLVGFGLWGMAAAMTGWAATQVGAIARQPFAMPHWAMSFPLAAFTALTLRLADQGLPGTAAMGAFGVLLLALTSLIVTALLLATARGLRDGSLLVPEPVGVPVVVTGHPGGGSR
jgi:tellurite resistance protein